MYSAWKWERVISLRPILQCIGLSIDYQARPTSGQISSAFYLVLRHWILKLTAILEAVMGRSRGRSWRDSSERGGM